MTTARLIPSVLALTAVLAAACGGGGAAALAARGGLPWGSETVKLDPARFSTRIDNPYWPMAPGTRWVYRETDLRGGTRRVEVTVTPRAKRIANGVLARVVTDRVTERGIPVEVTEDYYAQDRRGNVWYLGERTTEYRNGRPAGTHGSFEAGVGGAQAGIAMPARPRAGMRYRQEHRRGEAEDRARVLSASEQAEVGIGHFSRVLLTADSTPLEPRMLEYKLYARGVGPVLVLSASGGGGKREELVRFSRGSWR